jgi:hypothetical protein
MVQKLMEENSALRKEVTRLTNLLETFMKDMAEMRAQKTEKNEKNTYSQATKQNIANLPEPSIQVPKRSKPIVPKVDLTSKQKETQNYQQQEIMQILNAKWMGKQFYYLVRLADDNCSEIWIKNENINAETLKDEFHMANPGAPTTTDYELSSEWQTAYKKGRSIKQKLHKKTELTNDDIDYIANGLKQSPDEPKEFVKVHIQIANKKAFLNSSYKQKVKIFSRILEQSGLLTGLIKISFIGNSVVEIYLQDDYYVKFKQTLQSQGWKLLEDFNPSEVPTFGKTYSDMEIANRQTALIQRLAFLYAGTRLINLKKCILEGLDEATSAKVQEKSQEILEIRAGNRTAYVPKQVNE